MIIVSVTRALGTFVLPFLSLHIVGCATPPPPTTPPRLATQVPNPSASSPDMWRVDDSVIEKGRIATDSAITELVADLSSKHAAVRRQAALAMGISAKMGADVALLAPGLRAALRVERDESATVALIWALARTGEAVDVALIMGTLGPTFSIENGNDPKRNDPKASTVVLEAVGLAMGVLGRRHVPLTDKARRRLVELSGHDDIRVQYAAAYGLAREHEPVVDAQVLRTLEGLLGAKDREVRASAALGLARRQRGSTALARVLDDDQWIVSVEAVRGLLAQKNKESNRLLAKWLLSKRPGRSETIDAERVHPIREALYGFANIPNDESGRRVARSFSSMRGGFDLDSGQIKCLAEAILRRRTPSPQKLHHCAKIAVPSWWSKQLVAAVFGDASYLPTAARVKSVSALAADADPRVRTAAIEALGKLAEGEQRGRVIERVAVALSDRSVAVAGTATVMVAKLKPKPDEQGRLFAAIVERAGRELADGSELALTLVVAISDNKISAGLDICRLAVAHSNRSIATAGRECLDALGDTSVSGQKWVPKRPRVERSQERKLVWVVETTRGIIRIALDRRSAPRHVAAIIKLTNEKFYDGILFHRVVPNFVIQGGDPTGTGWGGPGFDIPAEPSAYPFGRGAVGIADAGPDTGGSQWFVMHSRAPHLEGRYTRIGVVESGMEVVDRIAVGDKIVSSRIERRDKM